MKLPQRSSKDETLPQTLFAAITIALIFEWVPWSIVHLGNAETYARRGYFHSVAGKEPSYHHSRPYKRSSLSLSRTQ